MKFLNIALSLFSVTPIAIVLSCSQQPTNTNNSSDATLETLKNLKEQLNQNPPQWKDNNSEGLISKNDFDQISIPAKRNLLLDKILLSIDDNTEGLQIDVINYEAKPNEDQKSGIMTFNIKLSLNEKTVETNYFNLPYKIVDFSSKALIDQKDNFVEEAKNQVALDPDLLPEVFDPSTTAFYKQIAINPDLDFEQWQKSLFKSFVKTRSGLKVTIEDFGTAYNSKDPTKSQLLLALVYHDPSTKEKWNAPVLKIGNINVQKELLIESNKTIIKLLNDGKEFFLKPNHEENLTENNILANTNFDDLKDLWMDSTDVTYQVIEFQNNKQQISFKLRITHQQKSIDTELLVFQLT